GKKHNILKRNFDRIFGYVSHGYARLVRFIVRPAVIGISLLAFAAACGLIGWSVTHVPTGFVPDQDKGLIVTEVPMPHTASQDRALAVIKQVEQILQDIDGVNHVGAFQGFSLIAGNGSNFGVAFAGLKPWSYRVPKGQDLQTLLRQMRTKFAQIQEGTVIA